MRMREFVGTSEFGHVLVEKYVSALLSSESYYPARLKSLRQELRSIFRFIRNEFAHNLCELEPSRGYALLSGTAVGLLEEDASWSSRRFDFRDAHIGDADLTGLHLRQAVVDFSGATIWGELKLAKGIWQAGEVNLIKTVFKPGSILNFEDTEINGANVRLIDSRFAGSHIRAARMKVRKGALRLDLADVSKSTFSFERSHFLGGSVIIQVRLKEYSHLRLAQVTVATLLHLRLNLREGASARLQRRILVRTGLIRFEQTVLQPAAQLVIEQPSGPTTSGINIDAPQYNGGSLRLRKLPIDDGPRITLGGNGAPAPDALLSANG
jgi:hypothetical protein